MKRSVKTQLRIVAVALLVMATGLIVGAVFAVRPYNQIFDQPWQKSFVSEIDYRYYKTLFRQMFFLFVPFMALLQVWAAWNILRCADRIPEAAVPAVK